jgi:microcystin degradation protein MlrC
MNDSQSPRVALAGMVLESNSFAPVTTEEDFRSRYYLEGGEILDQAAREHSVMPMEMTAFVRAMRATGPWEPVPLVLYLCNHGAMTTTESHDPDGEMAARVREAVGPDAVIVVTLDLHANISELLVESTDLIVGYQTNPHVDMRERAEEAAHSLRMILAGERAEAAFIRLPLTPASVVLLTREGPYADLSASGASASWAARSSTSPSSVASCSAIRRRTGSPSSSPAAGMAPPRGSSRPRSPGAAGRTGSASASS